MFKYIIALILITGVNFIVTVDYLNRNEDQKLVYFFDMAEKSYYLGCAQSLIGVGFPQEETMVICNGESQQYLQNLKDATDYKD